MELTGYSRTQVYHLKKEIQKGENVQNFKAKHQPSKYSDEQLQELKRIALEKVTFSNQKLASYMNAIGFPSVGRQRFCPYS